MPARRVCRRDPLPRRLDEICRRGPQLAWGKESAPSKADSGFRKGERASEGRGCSQARHAERRQKGKPERSRAVQRFTHGASSKSQLKKLKVVTRNSQKKNVTAIPSSDVIA